MTGIPSMLELNHLFKEFKHIRKEECSNTSSSEKKEKVARSLSQMSEMDLYVCSYCQESTLEEDDGCLVCTSCGRESGTLITAQQEWRNHHDSNGPDQSRCGMPVHPLLPQSSLGTIAQGYGKQGFRRLQMQNAMPSDERTLFDAIKKIKSSAELLNIPATLADKACYLYSELVKDLKIKRGPVRKALMANCQYAICKKKEYGFYICKEKLASAYEISMNKYNEGAKLFVNLSYHKNHEQCEKKWGKTFSSSRKHFVKPTEPENITENACKKLGFNDQQIAEVTYIVRQVSRLKLVSSRMPQSIAAGCLILYAKEKGLKKISIHSVATICVVSDATAKNTFNELFIGKNFLLPKKKEDLIYGKVGNCMPRKRLETIYIAPSRALPKSVIIPDCDSIKVESNRGRPKKVI